MSSIFAGLLGSVDETAKELKATFDQLRKIPQELLVEAVRALAQKSDGVRVTGDQLIFEDSDIAAVMLKWAFESKEVFSIGRDAIGFADSCLVGDFPDAWPALMLKPFWVRSADRKPIYDDVVGFDFTPVRNMLVLRIHKTNARMDAFVDSKPSVIFKNLCNECKDTEEHVARFASEGFHGSGDDIVLRTVKWAMTLAISIEANASPVVEKPTYCNSSRNRFVDMGPADANQVVNRYIRISDDYKERVRNLNSSVGHTLNTDGLTLSPAIVRPHMRYQACGANKEDRKWVYIAPYVSSRWKSGAFVNTKVTL